MSDVERGFTLVEILIIVLLLCILAMIVIPQFSDASDDARESAVKTDLQTVRAQIGLYRSEHRSTCPSKELFVEQMTSKTHPDGTLGGDLGPYLPAIPTNPYNNNSTVRCRDNDAQLGDGTTGWHYNATTGRFCPNDCLEHTAW